MPNWCSNNLSLSHKDPAMISRAKKAFEDGRLFDEFVPIPKDLCINADVGGDTPEQIDNVKKHGYTDWYSFCLENWGTKWDVSNGFINLDAPKELDLGFDTAWNPPVAFYKKMEELGFTVSADYREEGMGFIGEYSDGVDECYEYDFADDEWRNHLPEHIAEELESEYEFWKEYQEEEKSFEESQN